MKRKLADLPNPAAAPNRALKMDDLGDIEISEEKAELTKRRLREKVRRDWPHATDEEIEAVASEMEESYLLALRTGVINYHVAYEISERIAEQLHQRVEQAE